MSFNNFSREKLQTVELTDTFWNPGYGDDLVDKYPEHEVPIRKATAEAVKKYGTLVTDFQSEKIQIRQWPQEGRRPICKGTGVQAGEASGVFRYLWDLDVALATNEATVPDWLMITGRLPRDVSPSNRTRILVREANYHPDGSQVFCPRDGDAFVMLVAPPGDEVKPEDFEAFYFDGSSGMHINPKVWHQPLYPIPDTATYMGKQCAVYACVNFDSVEEFGVYLSVPLKL